MTPYFKYRIQIPTQLQNIRYILLPLTKYEFPNFS